MTRRAEPNAAPHVLIAMDKFKGSLTAAEVSECLKRGIQSVWADASISVVPMADGGEGTLDIALRSGYARHSVEVHGPDGELRNASLATCGDHAVLESASSSGLQHLGARLLPLTATSRGLGDLVRAALDTGSSKILVGLGGSASTDGGTGMLSALGVRFLDSEGAELIDGGGDLARLNRVDLTTLDDRVSSTQFTIACDVDYPLLGDNGAAAVFGAQKGATSEEIERLEVGLTRLDEVLRSTPDVGPTATTPGAGSAGGLGYAFLSVLGAHRRRGVDAMIELAGLETQMHKADLVIVGEGSLDEQSLQGKAPIGISRLATSKGIPVIAVSGRNSLDAAQMSAAGFWTHLTMSDLEPDLDRSIKNAGSLAEQLGSRIGEYLLADSFSTRRFR